MKKLIAILLAAVLTVSIAVLAGCNKQMLPFCDTAYITKVHTTTGCDTYFPNLDEMEDWYLADILLTGEENGIAYEMLLYRRK